MQGAGEEQRTQHAVEQRLVEVDGFEQALGFPPSAISPSEKSSANTIRPIVVGSRSVR